MSGSVLRRLRARGAGALKLGVSSALRRDPYHQGPRTQIIAFLGGQIPLIL